MGVEDGKGGEVVPFRRRERVIQLAGDIKRFVSEVIAALNLRMGEMQNESGVSEKERAEFNYSLRLRTSLEYGLKDMKLAQMLSEKDQENLELLNAFEAEMKALRLKMDVAKSFLGLGPER